MTGKQKLFADKVLANPKTPVKHIIKDVYDVKNDRTAEVMASENLRKPEIMLYLQNHAVKAEEGMVEVAEYSKKYGKVMSREGASYAAVAVSAYKDVLDRVHGKAKQTVDVSQTTVHLKLDLTGTLEEKAES